MAHVLSNNYTYVPNVGHTNKSPKELQSKDGEHGYRIYSIKKFSELLLKL